MAGPSQKPEGRDLGDALVSLRGTEGQSRDLTAKGQPAQCGEGNQGFLIPLRLCPLDETTEDFPRRLGGDGAESQMLHIGPQSSRKRLRVQAKQMWPDVRRGLLPLKAWLQLAPSSLGSLAL